MQALSTKEVRGRARKKVTQEVAAAKDGSMDGCSSKLCCEVKSDRLSQGSGVRAFLSLPIVVEEVEVATTSTIRILKLFLDMVNM